MPVRLSHLLIGVVVMLAACAPTRSAPLKLALLAPFEGRYSEIGYNALYAVRLALTDANYPLQLLAVDDGGSAESAALRVAALETDPAVTAIIALGPFVASATAQAELERLPMLIVGNWSPDEQASNTLILGSANITTDDVLGLPGIASITPDAETYPIESSGTVPDADFSARYRQLSPFAPEPGLLATLTYDATALIIAAYKRDTPLSDMRYEGINGVITFEDGYWQNAPVNVYVYEDGTLVQRP